MSLLGYDALGRLALGQLPSITSGPSFSKFSEPVSKTSVAIVATTYVGFVPTPVTAPVAVFSPFSTPAAKVVQQPTGSFVYQPVVVTTLTPVFSKFSEPLPVKSKQTDTAFRVLRPDAATPGPISFNRFSEPSFTKVRPQSDPSSNLFQAPVAATVIVGGDFADFDLVQSKKSQQQGFTGFVFVPSVQTVPFTKFDQPFSKRVLQQDNSFVNLPVVTVVTQPYVFTSFGQPQLKRVIDQPVSFAVNPPTVVVSTVNFSGFSDFGMPKKTLFIQQDFLDSPTSPAVQNYVFTQFSQPQVGKVYREGFTNAPFGVSVQNYLFSTFAQPQFRRVLQVDQSFVNLPVIIAQQPYLFSPFEQPRFKSSPQFDPAVQFEILQPPQVVSVVVFTGFSDFSAQQFHSQLTAALQSSVSYDIIIPVIPVSDGFAGKWHKLKGGLKPNVIKLDSSNIAEIIHNKNSNELTVKFQNDKVYHYNNIDEKKVKGLVRAKSSGRYLHNNIKGKYFTTRIK